MDWEVSNGLNMDLAFKMQNCSGALALSVQIVQVPFLFAGKSESHDKAFERQLQVKFVMQMNAPGK